MERWPLVWAHGEAEVIATAGMLHAARFRLASGRDFAPFALAPWAFGPPRDDGVSGHMRHLGGEFVCVPFGVGGPLVDPAPGWEDPRFAALNMPSHGPTAEDDWTLVEAGDGFLRLGLDYPADHLVARLERRIAGDPSAPALDFELAIHARREGKISVGLHPIFTLEAPERSVTIRAAFREGMTYPAAVAGDAMLAAIGAGFLSLDDVPGRDGGAVDMTRLPLERPVEDVVQLFGLDGPVEVLFAGERAGVRVDWDRTLLPSCQIWISDRALLEEPWSGRFRGLGIEPTASAFDFGDAVSVGDNPVRQRGHATSVALHADKPTVIRYRIEAFET